MKRGILSLLVPPMAVCRYGCAGCCAAPIGVFWLAGITGLIYGFLGGPAELPYTSWTTVALGASLWTIAAVWAWTTIRSVEEDAADPQCHERRSNVCRILPNRRLDSDPFDEIKKFQQ